jgi:hypothetical protein
VQGRRGSRSKVIPGPLTGNVLKGGKELPRMALRLRRPRQFRGARDRTTQPLLTQRPRIERHAGNPDMLGAIIAAGR